MPKGIYPRKKKNKKNLPAVVEVQQFPLEAIPERPQPVIKQPKLGIEPALIGLCHRMLDQQTRLMDMLQETKQPRKYKKRVKT